VGAVAFFVGVFGVVAGWHWKLMHRSWQDIRQVREHAKGKIPALKVARSQHTSKALVIAVVVAVLIFAVIH
jgi:cell division protein FtsL